MLSLVVEQYINGLVLRRENIVKPETIDFPPWDFYTEFSSKICPNKTNPLNISSGWWFGCHFLHFTIYWVAFIIPIDELIFFRGVAQPPTSHDLSLHLSYAILGSILLTKPTWTYGSSRGSVTRPHKGSYAGKDCWWFPNAHHGAAIFTYKSGWCSKNWGFYDVGI